MTQQDTFSRLRPLAELSPLVLVLVLLPMVLTGLIMTALRPNLSQWDTMEIRQVSWLTYTLANWLTLAALFGLLRRIQGVNAVFLFRRPTGQDWLLTVVAFAIGAFVIYPIAAAINSVLGTPMQGMDYQLENLRVVVLVTFWAVVTAPLAEEVLFRGLGIGYLLARGMAPWLAGLITIVLFALIHLRYFGVGGTVFILLWGTLPTVLRLWRGSLTVAWLMHVFNNTFAYILIPLLRG